MVQLMSQHGSSAAAILAVLAILGNPAEAVRSRWNANGVDGWCDFNWVSAHQVANVQCGAKDTACDSHPVYAELRLYKNEIATDVEKELGRYDMKEGCHAVGWDNTQHSWDSLPRPRIRKARVKACVNIQGGRDKCYFGNLVDNPHA